MADSATDSGADNEKTVSRAIHKNGWRWICFSSIVFCISSLSEAKEQDAHYKHSSPPEKKKSRQNVCRLEEANLSFAGIVGSWLTSVHVSHPEIDLIRSIAIAPGDMLEIHFQRHLGNGHIRNT